MAKKKITAPSHRFQIEMNLAGDKESINITIYDRKRQKFIKASEIHPPGYVERWFGVTWEGRVHKALKKFTKVMYKLEKDSITEEELERQREIEGQEILSKIKTDVGRED